MIGVAIEGEFPCGIEVIAVEDGVSHEAFLFGGVPRIASGEIGGGGIEIGPETWLSFPGVGAGGGGQISIGSGIESSLFDEDIGGVQFIVFDSLSRGVEGPHQTWLRDPSEIGLGGGLADLADDQVDCGVGEQAGIGAAFVGFGGTVFCADGEEKGQDEA